MAKMQVWDVQFWWRDDRGTVSSGANSSWPVGTSPMEVILEVARWRGVRLSECHSVSAHASGDPYGED